MKYFYLGALILILAPTAQAGNELGNGGDSFAQEFTALGRKLVEGLRRQPDPRIADLTALNEAIECTRVSTTDRLALEGAEVDAINFPKGKKIQVNRARWREYDVRQKAFLVLHEYLGIAGIDDSRYQISSAYLELPDLDGYTEPAKQARIERQPRSAAIGENTSFEVAEEKKAAGGRWSVGLGTNFSAFGGNAGKLYDLSITPELGVGYLVNSAWKLAISFSDANFSFVAVDQGAVRSRMRTLGGSLEYHFAGEKQWNGQRGFDPYVLGAIAAIAREQNFLGLNQIGNDTALKIGAGLGVNWYVVKGIAAFVEGRVANAFFKDRYDDTYSSSGVFDTTGLLYAANVGVQYVF